MTKPREFWIEPEGQQGEAFGVARDHNINASERAIHVIEVLPADSQENKVNWDKVWTVFMPWLKEVEQELNWEMRRNKIQDLVEKSLKGEL